METIGIHPLANINMDVWKFLGTIQKDFGDMDAEM